MTNDFKIAPAVACAEFDRWAVAMDIDTNIDAMDEEDRAAFNKQKGRIVRAIEWGHLVVNDNDEATYTPHREKSGHKEPITFHERTGASLMAMDGKKKGHDVAKTYAVMADMSGLPAKTFAGLVGPDIKVCEAIYALLMD